MTNLIITCACIVASIFIILIMLMIFLWYFFKKIYEPYKINSEYISIDELYKTLNVIIENEITLYENSVFDNGGKIISERTFEKYYNSIMEKIEASLSDNILLGKFCPYLKEEAVIRLASRIVRSYLSSKIM